MNHCHRRPCVRPSAVFPVAFLHAPCRARNCGRPRAIVLVVAPLASSSLSALGIVVIICCGRGLQGKQSLEASARLAQSAERKALNLVVVGSSPTVGVLEPARSAYPNTTPKSDIWFS